MEHAQVLRTADWAVLVLTIVTIVGWGLWKERGAKTAEVYLTGGRESKWWTIGLSIMATQASAITFLSMPGQAYTDGLGFVQFYLGQPVALVLLAAFVVPIYYRLKVYTAYEYLEKRFDRKTRLLTAMLFLLSRGLATGIAIYAPAIVLSTVLGWPLQLTNLIIGGVVIVYTVSGGTRIVSRTQSLQMVVMLAGMGVAAIVIWSQLPPDLSFGHALRLAGTLGRMKVIDYSTRFDTRYTFWSGMTGGLFVALAYFGTDQSQVQRYLGGSSLTESKLGLLFHGLFKVPMQFLILFVGVLLFMFYQFERPPLFFDEAQWSTIRNGPDFASARALERGWESAFTVKRERVEALLQAYRTNDTSAIETGREALRAAATRSDEIRERATQLVKALNGGKETKDADYIFIGFVVSHFPQGLVGLLLAVILCAAMSAVAASLNSLGTTTVVDLYKTTIRAEASDAHYLLVAKLFTVFWGVVAVLFAAFASQLDNLIQAVNILGSIFYGPMLGVFLVGFFLPRVRATPVFIAALLAQALVVAVWRLSTIGFLWYNVIGCGAVIAVSVTLSGVWRRRPDRPPSGTPRQPPSRY
jgi:Na+/proline symporter